MATAIVWDDDPPVEPAPLTKDKMSLEEVLAQVPGNPADIKRILEWADTNDLVAELAKRGYDAHPRITYYMPSTVSTPITTPTITTTSGTFTMPSSYQVYTQLIGAAASSSLQAQLMQNVATLGRSTTGK